MLQRLFTNGSTLQNNLHEDLFIEVMLARANSTMAASFSSLFPGGVDRLLPLM